MKLFNHKKNDKTFVLFLDKNPETNKIGIVDIMSNVIIPQKYDKITSCMHNTFRAKRGHTVDVYRYSDITDKFEIIRSFITI